MTYCPLFTRTPRGGGCWFCHNQSIGQLRLLRRDYPDYWELMLKWDADSPRTFHSDGRTIRDFERRFAAEDAGLLPDNKRFLWKMLDEIK